MTQTVLARFLSGAFSVGMGNLSTMVLGLVGVVIVARRLPAAALGTFVLLQVMATFLYRVSSLGLDLSIPKFIAGTEDENHRGRIFGTSLVLRGSCVVIVSVLAAALRPTLLRLFGESQLMGLFLFVPVFFLLLSMGHLFIATLQGFFRFRHVALSAFIASSSYLLLIVILVQLLNFGLMGLLYAKLISMASGSAFAFFSIPGARRPGFSSPVAGQLVRFGLPLQLNDVLTFAFMRVDTLVIGAMLGPAQIAYYEIARKIPESLTGLYQAFRAVYIPFVSKLHGLSQKNKLSEMLNNATRVISFFTALGALIALLFGGEVITLLFGERYLPSAPIFVLLMIGLNLTLVEYTLGYSLVAVGDSGKPLIISSIRTPINLVANLLLIPVFGMRGAALANIAANIVTSPMDVWFLRRKGIPAEIVGWVKPTVIFLSCGAVYLVLGNESWLTKLGFVAAFLAISGMFSVITRKDVIAILEQARGALNRVLRRPGLEPSR